MTSSGNRQAAGTSRTSHGGRHRGRVRLAVGETVILLHAPLPLVGFFIVMESGRQQNDRTLADG